MQNLTENQKMLKRTNDKVLMCFLDWLSISFIVSSRNQDEYEHIKLNNLDGYIIEECSGTNIFATRYIIYDNTGRKKITWLADPISPMINKNLCLIEFANPTLYSGEWTLLFDLLPQFHEGYFHRFSRVDIAGDFQYFVGERENYVKADKLALNLYHCDYYVKGKSQGTAFYHYENQKNKIKVIPHQLSWAAKQTIFKWKLYNKTKEINEESKKYYISNYHKQIGFNLSNDVWRLECSISKASGIVIKNKNDENLLTIENIKNPHKLTELFILLQKSRFGIKKNEKNLNKSRNTDIPLFNAPEVYCKVEKISSDKDILHDKVKSYINSSLSAIENVVFQYKFSLVDEIYKSIKDTIEQFNMYEWFEMITKMSVDDYYTYKIVEIRKQFQVHNNINKLNSEKNGLQCKIKFK